MMKQNKPETVTVDDATRPNVFNTKRIIQHKCRGLATLIVLAIFTIFTCDTAKAVPLRKTGEATKEAERDDANFLVAASLVLLANPISALAGASLAIYAGAWLYSLGQEDTAAATAITIVPRSDYYNVGLPSALDVILPSPFPSPFPSPNVDSLSLSLNRQIENFGVLVNDTDSYLVSLQRNAGAVLAGDPTAAETQIAQAEDDFSRMQADYKTISRGFAELASLTPAIPLDLKPSDLIRLRTQVLVYGLPKFELDILRKISFPANGITNERAFIRSITHEIALIGTGDALASAHVSSLADLFESSGGAIDSFNYSAILPDAFIGTQP
jgi:hypothetical protein